jgi:hypothetical protein
MDEMRKSYETARSSDVDAEASALLAELDRVDQQLCAGASAEFAAQLLVQRSKLTYKLSRLARTR